jgi:hypothetical protein
MPAVRARASRNALRRPSQCSAGLDGSSTSMFPAGRRLHPAGLINGGDAPPGEASRAGRRSATPRSFSVGTAPFGAGCWRWYGIGDGRHAETETEAETETVGRQQRRRRRRGRCAAARSPVDARSAALQLCAATVTPHLARHRPPRCTAGHGSHGGLGDPVDADVTAPVCHTTITVDPSVKRPFPLPDPGRTPAAGRAKGRPASGSSRRGGARQPRRPKTSEPPAWRRASLHHQVKLTTTGSSRASSTLASRRCRFVAVRSTRSPVASAGRR